MTFDDIYSAVEALGNVTAFGAKLKFELGDNVILIDGTGDKMWFLKIMVKLRAPSQQMKIPS